jgi:adenine deaminase
MPAFVCVTVTIFSFNAGNGIAAEWVIRKQGGICVVHGGTIAASIALPVAGLISENPLSRIAPKIQNLQEAMVSLGFSHANPPMSFSTITLPVSPALKITDKGLVDVENGKLVDLIVSI